MWRDHAFSQRNKATKRAVWGKGGQNLKEGKGGGVGKMGGGLRKVEGLETLCQL